MEDFKSCAILDEESTQYDVSFKIILIGESGVGKSNLTLKGAKNKFEESHNATVGFEFLTLSVQLDDKVIKLQIWDTCGQEIYRSLITSLQELFSCYDSVRHRQVPF